MTLNSAMWTQSCSNCLTTNSHHENGLGAPGQVRARSQPRRRGLVLPACRWFPREPYMLKMACNDLFLTKQRFGSICYISKTVTEELLGPLPLGSKWSLPGIVTSSGYCQRRKLGWSLEASSSKNQSIDKPINKGINLLSSWIQVCVALRPLALGLKARLFPGL